MESTAANSLPHPWVFVFSPLTRIELQASFLLSDKQWTDTDLPITYLFGYFSNEGTYTFLYRDPLLHMVRSRRCVSEWTRNKTKRFRSNDVMTAISADMLSAQDRVTFSRSQTQIAINYATIMQIRTSSVCTILMGMYKCHWHIVDDWCITLPLSIVNSMGFTQSVLPLIFSSRRVFLVDQYFLCIVLWFRVGKIEKSDCVYFWLPYFRAL